PLPLFPFFPFFPFFPLPTDATAAMTSRVRRPEPPLPSARCEPLRPLFDVVGARRFHIASSSSKFKNTRSNIRNN
ncbi:hypothetical protein WJH60_33090, partial [Burkholderia orbicola]|uniref:hypothetical protein n=1 Tax=Burkholderia orbicola TaxID=2978683 RepID=UPI0035C6C33D